MLRRYLCAAFICAGLAVAARAQCFPEKIEVDARGVGAELTPIWRFFGADEPTYATMKDGRALLAELGAPSRCSMFSRCFRACTDAGFPRRARTS